MIWTPQLSLLSSFRQDIPVSSRIPVVISDSGLVRGISKTRLTAACGLNFESFPFDRHQCTLIFGSRSHDVDLHPLGETIKELGKTSTWSIISSSIDYAPNQQENITNSYLALTINLARNAGVYNQFFEVILLTLVVTTLIVFWMSPQDVEMRVCLSLFSIALSFFTIRESTEIIGFQEESHMQTFLTWIVIIALIDCIFSLFLFFFVNQIFESPLPIILAFVVRCPLGKMLLLEQTAIAFDFKMPAKVNSRMNDREVCVFLREEWLIFAVFLDRVFFFIQLSFTAMLLVF